MLHVNAVRNGYGEHVSATTRPAGRPSVGLGRSLTDQVAEAVRAAIRTRELEPGRLYSAYQIADQLGVSRSPVREALLRLAESGLVRMERNRGFRIVVPAAHEIAEIFALRLLLEVPATRRAAERGTPTLHRQLRAELAAMDAARRDRDEARFMDHDRQLHDHILLASGNRRLAVTIDRLREVTRMLGASTVDRSRGLRDIQAEQLPIVEAIEAGDGDLAADHMRRHIEHTGRLLVAQSAAEELDPDELWRTVVG